MEPAAESWRRLRLLMAAIFIMYQLLFFCFVKAQDSCPSTVTTDPTEASLLNTIFRRWGISATSSWNISGDLCTGQAIDGSPIFSTDSLNPGIKCVCSTINNNSAYHITALKINRRDISGSLPDELWNLTLMTDLNLQQNYLTGSIPPDIARLNRMEYLSFAANALTGRIPSELGQLTNLRSLSFGINNFNGTLPPELGNLARLEQLYINSCGLSGSIPETFSNLRNLETVWASDNDFTGEIPTYIGNWRSLNVLRLQGNSFQGPIPSSFSNLTMLTDLRVSDVSNMTSSLNFLQNMTSLIIIYLRNNLISDSIPTFFGSFQNLGMLDLSFNDLTGSIPSNIFLHTRLTSLYLGNNSLTGTLPSEKSSILSSIDVSYNWLSGVLPPWINEQNLNLNLVANNFTIDSSSRSVRTMALDCLQRSFGCHRRSPISSGFAIKCGGPQITASDGITYEADSETLGPANYNMISTGRWAVSNVGFPMQSSNSQYLTTSSSQFTNTVDSQLFQTSRISAGSLRYYGLGLENGNYTITLQFAESLITGTRTWTSVGRRIFDVYIQGNLVLRDFNIQRETNGITNRAVVKHFNVSVIDHHVEIHLFWAGKGTCCVPSAGTYGPIISAISASPNFVSRVSNITPGIENHTGLVLGVIFAGVVIAISLVLFAIFLIRRKRRKYLEDQELVGIGTRPHTFSYSELKAATNDFNTSNKLGAGGFGPVYKGTLGDGRVVAIKQLSTESKQGKPEFLAEIASISAVQHRNLVTLYGCCIEGTKRLLVYEFLENESLDKILFGSNSKGLSLDWPTRYEICLGIARGLMYLHEESRVRIVHRDVKASNILLDSKLTPKISDFGLAKLFDEKHTHISTKRIAGTVGYTAPEYALRGHLTEKVDIFSFAVLALEIVNGRRNSNSTSTSISGNDHCYLLERAWGLYESKNILKLVDPMLQKYDSDEVKRVIGVALLCTQTSPNLRPPMSRVVTMLSGDVEIAPVTSRPAYLNELSYEDKSFVDTSTSYPTTFISCQSFDESR